MFREFEIIEVVADEGDAAKSDPVQGHSCLAAVELAFSESPLKYGRVGFRQLQGSGGQGTLYHPLVFFDLPLAAYLGPDESAHIDRLEPAVKFSDELHSVFFSHFDERA